MKDSYIAVLDSGIGGISVLKALIEKFPYERFIYYGDNKNAPYGNRSLNDLMMLTMKNIDYIKHYNIKALVLGCNTLSINLFFKIQDYAGVPVFGVFPPVEAAIMSSRQTLLLATKATSKCYTAKTGLDVVGLDYLVNDVENNMFNLEKVDFKHNLDFTTGRFISAKGYYDTVILGCTHYIFIKNKIFDHFCPKKIISGNDYLILAVDKFLKNDKRSVKHLCFKPIFIGDCAYDNEKFYVKSGQNCFF